MQRQKVLAVIPARGGSKGVPGKNIRDLGGKPLIAWTIAQALACPRIDRVVVSTDSPAIAAIAREHGAQVPFLRPAALAEDTTPTEPVLLHALDHLAAAEDYHPDALMLLQATSPWRRPGTLAAAVALYESSGADCLLSAAPAPPFLWSGPPTAPRPLHDSLRRPRRQDIPDDQRRYAENGSFYITATAVLRATGDRLGGDRRVLHVLHEDEAVDIDSETDFAIAAAVIAAQTGKGV